MGRFFLTSFSVLPPFAARVSRAMLDFFSHASFLARRLYASWKRRFRTGSLVSRLLRPLFELPKIRVIFGANLAAAVVFGTLLPGSFHPAGAAAAPQEIQAASVLSVTEPVLETQVGGFQIPTMGFLGVSTRFRAGHPGYDLRATLGSEIRPIAEGVVVSIIHSSFGYGRRVMIAHREGFVSLYAHLGKVTVEEGQTVTKTTQIGEVGLTGWTTGPHLHLEIYQEGVAVNPGPLLGL